MAAAFEKDASFRSSIFAAYKANRKQPPEDLEAQFDYCRKITEAIGVTCLEVDDYEADDVIGTIATRMSAAGHPVVVVTGDKDMSQLVCDGVRVYDMAKEHWLDEAAVREKFGVCPGPDSRTCSPCTAIMSTTFPVLWVLGKKPRGRSYRFAETSKTSPTHTHDPG